jgi:hypothetical protein
VTQQGERGTDASHFYALPIEGATAEANPLGRVEYSGHPCRPAFQNLAHA